MSLVTSITSIYNGGEWLNNFYKDMLIQDKELSRAGHSLEMILVPVGGSDIGNPPEELPVHVINVKRRAGLYFAWNLAIHSASGRYITVSNVDDRHAPYALSDMASFLDSNEDVSLVYGSGYYTKHDTLWGNMRVFGKLEAIPFSPSILCKFGCYIHPHPMWRSKLHDKYGIMNTRFLSAGDYEWYCRLVRGGEKFHFINKPMSLMYKGEGTLGNSNMNASMEEARLVRRMYG